MITEEDYPGQKREIEINEAVQKAVQAADSIIFDVADGSVEEMDFLTVRVAEAFFKKVQTAIYRNYQLRQLRDTLKR